MDMPEASAKRRNAAWTRGSTVMVRRIGVCVGEVMVHYEPHCTTRKPHAFMARRGHRVDSKGAPRVGHCTGSTAPLSVRVYDPDTPSAAQPCRLDLDSLGEQPERDTTRAHRNDARPMESETRRPFHRRPQPSSAPHQLSQQLIIIHGPRAGRPPPKVTCNAYGRPRGPRLRRYPRDKRSER